MSCDCVLLKIASSGTQNFHVKIKRNYMFLVYGGMLLLSVLVPIKCICMVLKASSSFVLRPVENTMLQGMLRINTYIIVRLRLEHFLEAADNCTYCPPYKKITIFSFEQILYPLCSTEHTELYVHY